MANLIALLTAILSTLVSSEPAAPVDDRYNKEVPYGNALTSPIKAPPEGYEQIFIENVGRHGSRTLTSSAGEARARKIWDDAKDENALTVKGRVIRLRSRGVPEGRAEDRLRQHEPARQS